MIADLGKYELAHNPDGQVQFVDGKPVDALSNPFAMTMSRYGLIVADGGANDVLRVDPSTGRVSTFFVPHTVTDVKACLAPGAQSNPGTVGCDPVPTGVAVSRGSVYVSTLGAEQPGRRARLQARRAHRQGAAGLAGADLADRHRGPRRRHGLRVRGAVRRPGR